MILVSPSPRVEFLSMLSFYPGPPSWLGLLLPGSKIICVRCHSWLINPQKYLPKIYGVWQAGFLATTETLPVYRYRLICCARELRKHFSKRS